MTKGVKFWGENGWIEVARGYFNASDPKFNPPASAASTMRDHMKQEFLIRSILSNLSDRVRIL